MIMVTDPEVALLAAEYDRDSDAFYEKYGLYSFTISVQYDVSLDSESGWQYTSEWDSQYYTDGHVHSYTNRDEGQDVPESVIEAFVVKIVVSKEGFDWYLRFDGDPDKPLRCKLEGKRKTTTKISVSGDHSPTADEGATGCYQGLRNHRHPIYI